MKNLWRISVVVLFALLFVAGCSKSAPRAEVAEINGVKIDLVGFQRAFESTTNQEIQQNVTEAIRGIRYKMYDKCLDALEKLNNDPNLTPEQKKIAASFMESAKQLAAASLSAPAQ